LLFSSSLRIRDSPIEESENDEDKLKRRIRSITEGIMEFTRGTEFESNVDPTEDYETRSPRDNQLITEYTRFVTGEWEPCKLPLLNMDIPNYVQLVTVTFLNAEDPQKLFKINNSEPGCKGGYGTVFTAKHIETGKKFAIKKMFHSTPEQMAKNYKEVAIMASCSHENIVQCMGCYQLDEELWIVLELLEGGSLDDIFSLYESLPEEQVAFIAQEVETHDYRRRN